MNIIVKGKTIPLSGVAIPIANNNEETPLEINFVFNTKGEHSDLTSIEDWKVYYQAATTPIHSATLIKTISENNTFTLSWNVEKEVIGIMLDFGIVGKRENFKWKTIPCRYVFVCKGKHIA